MNASYTGSHVVINPTDELDKAGGGSEHADSRLF